MECQNCLKEYNGFSGICPPCRKEMDEAEQED